MFFELTLFSQRYVEDDMEIEESYDVSFTELTKEDLEYCFESGGMTAFIWLNNMMEIEKAVIWGINTVIE